VFEDQIDNVIGYIDIQDVLASEPGPEIGGLPGSFGQPAPEDLLPSALTQAFSACAWQSVDPLGQEADSFVVDQLGGDARHLGGLAAA
jgi:hypothetical protein